jgi:hypothetical protein
VSCSRPNERRASLVLRRRATGLAEECACCPSPVLITVRGVGKVPLATLPQAPTAQRQPPPFTAHLQKTGASCASSMQRRPRECRVPRAIDLNGPPPGAQLPVRQPGRPSRHQGARPVRAPSLALVTHLEPSHQTRMTSCVACPGLLQSAGPEGCRSLARCNLVSRRKSRVADHSICYHRLSYDSNRAAAAPAGRQGAFPRKGAYPRPNWHRH